MTDLRKLRNETGLTADEIVAILREQFPKIDKTCISKAESGKYGLALSREAMRYLRAHIYGVPTQKEKRIKRHCVSVRLTDEEYAWLQQYLQSRPGRTAQDFFDTHLKDCIDPFRDFRDFSSYQSGLSVWNGGDAP